MVKRKNITIGQKASETAKNAKNTIRNIKEDAEQTIEQHVDVEELKKEIRERPLLYTGFALTLGVAIGSLMSKRRD
jgi:ElaB/YqjD/DUF883 family membrane-anchored ribosome-binding protein